MTKEERTLKLFELASPVVLKSGRGELQWRNLICYPGNLALFTRPNTNPQPDLVNSFLAAVVIHAITRRFNFLYYVSIGNEHRLCTSYFLAKLGILTSKIGLLRSAEYFDLQMVYDKLAKN